MKQDGNPDVEKFEKIYVNRRLFSVDHQQSLVTCDNTRKEIINIEKKCKQNWSKYDHLSGENVKRLVEECFNDSHDDVIRKKNENKDKLSSTMKVLGIVIKPSPPIPNTSSAIIGWRSSSNDYNLEIFGPLYISPRHTMVSLEPGEISNQRFISLG